MRRFLVVLSALALRLPATAPADWVDMKSTAPDDMLFSVGRDSVGLLYVGGMMFSTGGGGMPSFGPVLKRWFDGDKSWRDLGKGLGSGFEASPVMDMHFINEATGWLAMDKTIRYQQRLGTWKKVELDEAVTKLHMFDATRGVACGTGGKIWRTEDGGLTWDGAFDVDSRVNFETLQCFADGRCFAAGQESEKIEVEQGTQTRYKDWEVWAGTKFGRNWQRVHRETPAATDGESVGPIFFLPGGTTGWLVVAEWDKQNSRTKQVRLLKTVDGGASFVDMNLPAQVGTFNMFFTNAIYLSMVSAMYWEDASRGRLIGAAYVADEPTSAGGTPPPIYRRTDFVTTDGGKNWTKPNLGEITMDMTGGASPQSDPRPFGGYFDSWVQGIVVGEKGLVQAWQLSCSRNSECGTGYLCDRGTLVCVPDPDVPGPDAGAGSDDTGSARDAIDPADIAQGADGAVTGDIRIPNDVSSEGSGGGCAGGGVPVPGAMVPVLLGFIGLAWARTRRFF